MQVEEDRSDSLAALCKLARTIDTSCVTTAHSVALALRDAFGHMPSPEPIEALGHVLLAAYSSHAARGINPSGGAAASAATTAPAVPVATFGSTRALVAPISTGAGSIEGSSGASSPTKSSAASAADAAAAARSGAASALKAATAMNGSSELGLNSFRGTPGGSAASLPAPRAATASGMESETAKQFGWLHSSIVVMLEDRRPASAVRMLLRGCEVAGDLGEGAAAEALLSSALAVYERCGCLPYLPFLHCIVVLFSQERVLPATAILVNVVDMCTVVCWIVLGNLLCDKYGL